MQRSGMRKTIIGVAIYLLIGLVVAVTSQGPQACSSYTEQHQDGIEAVEECGPLDQSGWFGSTVVGWPVVTGVILKQGQSDQVQCGFDQKAHARQAYVVRFQWLPPRWVCARLWFGVVPKKSPERSTVASATDTDQ